jgi:hypothetical protein
MSVSRFVSTAILLVLAAASSFAATALRDVTQPGDPILASSPNSPEGQGVANAIDNQPTKYLNLDSSLPEPIPPSGFVVTPSVGATVVVGMTVESADDAPERDPKTVTLEGSNDDTITSFNGGNWEFITTINIPDFTDRLQRQQFEFSNSKSYKSYRWTVTATRIPNGCCMQVAEVELLAVVEGPDCANAHIVTQPVNQLILLGSKATFQTSLNGPWPLQWLKNGQPIPGATETNYTTEAITNAAMATNIYAVQILGCEISNPAQVVIFTPAASKSIGVNFTGGSANGAPSKVFDDDIVGVQLQAHWNNALLDAARNAIATPDSGSLPDFSLDPPIPVLDSDGNSSLITFRWDSVANSGSGTGEDTATARMLNGLVGRAGPDLFYNFFFENIPAGTHSLIVYSVAPPNHTATVSYKVGDQTYYMRVMNSGEYNSTPGLVRSTSTLQAGAAVGNYVRFDGINVPADGGTIQLTCETLDTFAEPTGVNGLQLLLNPAPTLTFSATGDTLTINFGAGSRLETTTELKPGAVWTEAATTSPYGEKMTSQLKFFRAVSP